MRRGLYLSRPVLRLESLAGDGAADSTMAALAQCRDRGFAQFGLLAVKPFIGFIVGESRVGEEDEGAAQVSEDDILAVLLDELVAGDREGSCRTRGYQPPIGDERADVAEPNIERFSSFW